MIHKQNLINIICLALAQYIGDRDDIPVFDVIGALDAIQQTITESMIKEHPEIVPQLSAIMKAHGH